MKKIQFRFMVLLSVLAVLVSIAAVPMAGSAISLIEVRNDPLGGVIFVFSVNGKLSKSELKGFVQVQGGDANYSLGCNQVDESTVQCTTSKKAGGNNVVVTFGGSTFWTYVPEAATPYCYNVYDYPPGPFSPDIYAFTTQCQRVPASYGDMLIDFYNPDWGGYFDYEFLPESPVCYNDILEDAYYYPYCPS